MPLGAVCRTLYFNFIWNAPTNIQDIGVGVLPQSILRYRSNSMHDSVFEYFFQRRFWNKDVM